MMGQAETRFGRVQVDPPITPCSNTFLPLKYKPHALT